MAEKVAQLGLDRDPEFMYFIKSGDVWRLPRRRESDDWQPERVAECGVEVDGMFVYFLDREGDVSRCPRPDDALAGANPDAKTSEPAPEEPPSEKSAPKAKDKASRKRDKKTRQKTDKTVEKAPEPDGEPTTDAAQGKGAEGADDKDRKRPALRPKRGRRSAKTKE